MNTLISLNNDSGLRQFQSFWTRHRVVSQAFDSFFSVGISWYQIAARDDTLSESMYVRLGTVEVRLDVAVVANQPK